MNARVDIPDMVPTDVGDPTGAYQVVDVRTHDEYCGELGHISGAKLIPLNTLRSALGELDPNQPVLSVCRSGQRSLQAAKLMAAHGFEVVNLQGGMMAWRGAGLPTELCPEHAKVLERN